MRTLIKNGTIIAVSYTHLDVYKRQIKGRVPFLNFFDGFRTSHEIQKIDIWDYEDLKDMVDMDAIEAFRARALNPCLLYTSRCV